MTSWIIMIVVPLLFTWLSEESRMSDSDFDGNNQQSAYIRYNNHGNINEKAYWGACVLFLVLFAGLRVRYNDTTTYLSGFENDYLTPKLDIFLNQESFRLDNSWGYLFTKSFLKTIGMDKHLILLTFTIWYVSVYLWFLRKYSQGFLLLAMFVFMVSGYTMLMAAIKQVMSISFALIAIDSLLLGRRVRFVFWLFVAITFHPYVIVTLLIVFFIDKKPWSISTWILIFFMIILGIGMEQTASFIAQYDDRHSVELMLDHRINPIRFLVHIVPMVLSFLFRDMIFEDSSREEDLFAHCSICYAMFTFWALFGNPIVFSRIAYYFGLINNIFLAWTVNKIDMKSEDSNQGLLLKGTMVVLYIFYSCYSEVLLGDFTRQSEHISFQQLHNSISDFLMHWMI